MSGRPTEQRSARGITIAALVLGVLTVLGLGLIVLGLGLIVAPPAAATSCAGDESISRSLANGSTVFVGTAVSTTNRGKWVTFAVEEVWSGEPGTTQVVKAGVPPQDDPTQFAGFAGEHTFRPGVRYLVDAYVPSSWTAAEAIYADEDDPFEPGDLVDGPCSRTTEWNDSLAVDRPPSARIVVHDQPIEIIGEVPDPKPADTGSSNGTRILVVVAILVIAALCLYFLFRRGSIADRAKADVPDP